MKNDPGKMREFAYLLFLTLFTTLIGCGNENDSSDQKNVKYTVTGQMTVNQEEVSNIKINFDSSGNSQVVENDGISVVDTIENGKELWFSFAANRGELYKISWQDSWWENYTAGGIYVTAYENDKSTTYFAEETLIQMTGSPKVISIPNDGTVFIRVRGYDTDITGTFAISAEKLNTAYSIPVLFDTSEHLSIAAGEVQLCTFQVQKGSSYTVTIEGSLYSGAYGDQVEVIVTALRENVNDPYFVGEPALYPPFQDDGQGNVQHFSALDTEIVYLAVVGAYWWDPRDITLTVTNN